MKPSTKKGLYIVGGVILVAGAIIGINYFRKKRIEKPAPEEKRPEQPSQASQAVSPASIQKKVQTETKKQSPVVAPKKNGENVYVVKNGEPIRLIPYPNGEIYMKGVRAQNIGKYTGKRINGFVQLKTATGRLVYVDQRYVTIQPF